MQTKVSLSPAGELELPSLRGYLIDHPRFGVLARPELRPKLAKHLHEIPEGLTARDVCESDTMLCLCLEAGRARSRTRIQKFIRLWWPKGPLGFPQDWLEDELEFMDWFRAHG